MSGPEHSPSTDEQRALFENYAARTWEAWHRDPGVLPTNQQWADLANPHLVTLRLGLACMWQTKAELIESCFNKDDAMSDFVEHLDRTAKMLEAYASLARSAQARLISALSVIDLRDRGAS